MDFGFYLVMTNPAVGYLKCAEAAVKAGVKMLQLRMKHAADGDILKTAKEIAAITRGTQTNFIVNDSPAIAAAAGADGVHVGQDDMPPARVRREFPSLRIVGLSTHNLAQVQAANALPPGEIDYIGTGPVFATPTKDIPDPVLTPSGAGAMIAASRYPAVAIGGINLSNLRQVKAAGARNFAVVRQVCSSPDPYAAICELVQAWDSIKIPCAENPPLPDGCKTGIPASFKCRGCGACCRIPGGIVRVSESEIERIAAFLGMSTREFIDRETEISPDRIGLVLKDAPDGACAWLDGDNRCRIHPVKPDQCRRFPHDWINADSYSVCPALADCK